MPITKGMPHWDHSPKQFRSNMPCTPPVPTDLIWLWHPRVPPMVHVHAGARELILRIKTVCY